MSHFFVSLTLLVCALCVVFALLAVLYCVMLIVELNSYM